MTAQDCGLNTLRDALREQNDPPSLSTSSSHSHILTLSHISACLRVDANVMNFTKDFSFIIDSCFLKIIYMCYFGVGCVDNV